MIVMEQAQGQRHRARRHARQDVQQAVRQPGQAFRCALAVLSIDEIQAEAGACGELQRPVVLGLAPFQCLRRARESAAAIPVRGRIRTFRQAGVDSDDDAAGMRAEQAAATEDSVVQMGCNDNKRPRRAPRIGTRR
ncbi:hypothetical protein CE205_11735 [Achromobacter insolitus]|nr:hypothetical protein CE205_11735 [Achromobacter insolitus]